MRFPRLRRKGLGLEAKPGPKREEGATAGTLFSLDSHLPARLQRRRGPAGTPVEDVQCN